MISRDVYEGDSYESLDHRGHTKMRLMGKAKNAENSPFRRKEELRKRSLARSLRALFVLLL